jgi:PAS domain S-box-containing protein
LVLAPVAGIPNERSLGRLEREYELASELEAPWAVCPLSLHRHEGRLVLLLEDCGGSLLSCLTAQPLGLQSFLHIAIGLAAAVGQVHQHSLIHKDLKPGNVFVDRDNNVRLTGFGFASRLLRERQELTRPECIEGTLAYMAPEQTGRMNRWIDTRSDLYSLGVTYYEMLTGKLPFEAADALEWAHCHIARQPLPPSERLAVPEVLSAIVLRLLSKSPEDRYKTAFGVESDLRRCLADWELHGRVDGFRIGTHDASDRLLISEKLYGREGEVAALFAAYERVLTKGNSEAVFVSGSSGIGKSSVVNELQKAVIASRGLFASGKFDRFKRDVPYATFAQAFQRLVREILSNGDAEIAFWRNALTDALGSNGQILINILPELELIIGKQPPLPDLSPQEAQTRTQMVLRKFVAVFARPEHPLVLFLDDLQWLDAATLQLVRDLITQTDLQHLLLVGAYRDRELSTSHPLMSILEEIRRTGANAQQISLKPLLLEEVTNLLADSVFCDLERAQPLAQLIYEKTGGNPFFTTQFVTALSEDKLVVFEPSAKTWRWNLDQIRARGFGTNIVDFLIEKLTRLSEKAQSALRALACLGSAAELTTLKIAFGDFEQALLGGLDEAIRSGYVSRGNEMYSFLHDRIQEAAYALIPEDERPENHLRLGRQLAAKLPMEKRQDAIFEIANQFNRGEVLIASRDEREKVADLNLTAGLRAKSSTDYASALIYINAANRLLQTAPGQNYALTFATSFHRAECEFLTGNLAAAEEQLSNLSRAAADGVDRAGVTCLQSALYTATNRFDRAIEVSLQYLQHSGVNISPRPTDEEVAEEYARISQRLGNASVESLIDLPVMRDSGWRAAMDVLMGLLPPARFTHANLHALATLKMVNLSLQHGMCDAASLACAQLSLILGPHFGNFEAGLSFGQLGLEMVERRGFARFNVRVYTVVGYHVLPWTRHLRNAIILMQQALEAATQAGDLTFAAYSSAHLISLRLSAGKPLPDVQHEAERGLAWTRKMGFGLLVDVFAAQLVLISFLRGVRPEFASFSDEISDEESFEQHLIQDSGRAIATCWYWIRKLQARYHAGLYEAALDAAAKAERLSWTGETHWEWADYHFFGALAHAASYDCSPVDDRQRHLEALAVHYQKLSTWTENCPENFKNRVLLVSAELARIEGRDLEAMQLYEEAIRASHEGGFLESEGIANELAAKFHGRHGLDTSTYAYIRQAQSCYDRWGALGKVAQLAQIYPGLGEKSVSIQDSGGNASIQQVDALLLVKASQALSSEIVLSRLIEALIRLAIEAAGADRGLLILQRGENFQIEAEAVTHQTSVEVTLRHTALGPGELAQSILDSAIRSGRIVIVDDAVTDSHYSGDGYVQTKHPRSVLCLPLVKQAALVGFLYLENKLATHAFTSDHVTLLELLASQAAISLENARLYSDLQRSHILTSHVERLSRTGSWSLHFPSGEIDWSDETYRILGFDRKTKPTLEQVRQRIHPDDLAYYNEVTERGIRERADVELQFRIIMPDGSIKYIQTTRHAIRDSSGQLVQYMGVVRDINERKRSEDALQQAQSELAYLARVATMGELTASIAHEVNQPLTGIGINANACQRWLAGDSPNFAEACEAVQRIVRDVNRASEVIARIRTLFQKSETIKTAVDLNRAIQEVLEFTRKELQRNRVMWRLDLASNVPLVLGDRGQLQQIMMNLILNAIEAMPTAEERPRELLLKTQWDGDPLVDVTVRDSGIGIDPDSVELIFKAFHTTKPKGMGMGLSICRSIIENHGGRIWATPNEGPGATFHFTIPKAPNDQPNASNAQNRPLEI